MKVVFKRSLLLVSFLTILLISGFQNCASKFESSKSVAPAASTVPDPFAAANGANGTGSTTVGTPDTGSGGSGGATTCTASKTFNVITSTTTTSVFDYSASYKIDVACADVAKDKFAFVAAQFGGVNYVYNPNTKLWTSYVPGSDMTSFAIVLPKQISSYPFSYFSFSGLDFAELGGAKIFSGYGLGSTPKAAFDELFLFRDLTHSEGRYNVVYTVPVQPAAVSINVSSSTAAQFNADATVLVRSADYNKMGYYFIGATSPDGLSWYTYDGQNWAAYNANSPVSFGAKTNLKNKVLHTTYAIATGQLANYKLYAGYAASDTLAAAFTAFINNSQGTRNTDGYVIGAPASSNWAVTADVTGNLVSYSVKVALTVATADLQKDGYYLLFALFENKYYILNVKDSTHQDWVLWDGAMAGFSGPIKLASKTGTNSLTMTANMDVTPFGGALLYAGYGVGNNIVAAVNEALAVTRWKQIATIAVQNFSGEAIIPTYNKTSAANVDLQFYIRPGYKDYGQAGRYYIAASAPDGTFYVYNGSTWILFNDVNNDLLFTDKVDVLVNYSKKITMKGTDLAPFAGWKLYVGYGKNIQDMLDRHLFTDGVALP